MTIHKSEFDGMTRFSLIAMCGGTLSLFCAPAFPLNSCSVSATGVAFGTYSPTSATALTGTGTVNVSCGLGVSTSWNILLDTGGSGTYTGRLMKNGAASLKYNLYTDAAHTIVWGDGTGGTGIDSQPATLLTLGGINYTVYGVVAALQDMPTGTYADVITVTLNYN